MHSGTSRPAWARLTLAGAFVACVLTPAVGRADAAPTYEQLVQYEGLYEYENDLTLQIAASPKDKVLVALLSGAKYPLVHATGDTFLDASGRKVAFQRDTDVTGYTLSNTGLRLYRRLSPGVRPPERSWYPRLPAEALEPKLSAPRDLGDGLKVGSLRDSGLDVARIEELLRQTAQGKFSNVHSVLIVKGGKLVVEEYFYEYDADTLHQLRSVTKSFVSALVGLAIERGLIASVHDPVLPFFEKDYPAIANLTERKRKITIEDLLTQRSGLDCNDYDRQSAGHEDRMDHTDDWVKFILDVPMLHDPGTVANYCSGGIITLGRIVEKASGKKLDEFAREQLFEPLGIRKFDWHFAPDRSSRETFCQLSLRPRDMAKFGLLYFGGGVWNGRQVVPAAWVKASVAKHAEVDNTDYGYAWWRPYLNVPGGRHQGILATGNGGQKIYFWPELDLLVVLTGGSYNVESPSKELLVKYILPPVVTPAS